MVKIFMEGIDPFFQNMLDNFLSHLFKKIPENYMSYLTNKKGKGREKILIKLKEVGFKHLEEFRGKLELLKIERHASPIIETVSVLQKDDIAAMAESLVNLTSFRRKVASTEEETVGGPIDVAVISKGDGFIWINRKHYFKPELNQRYVSRFQILDTGRTDGK